MPIEDKPSKYIDLTQDQIELIRRADLFDEVWYVEQHPDVAHCETAPFDHYVNIGLHQDLNPGPGFFPLAYLKRYPDVRAAKISPLLHYVLFGRQENRDPLDSVPVDMFSTKVFLDRLICDYDYMVGDHTYGHPRVIESRDAQLRIGKYTSIGPQVDIILGNHQTKLVTTYPFKGHGDAWPTAAFGEDDHLSNGDISIGNDVWIGANCTILSGVIIDDGAVIGAGSVLRKNVPAYSIVIGNPSFELRKRFDDRTIQRLLKVQWWHWSDEKVSRFLPLMLNRNIDAFLDAAEAA